LGIAGRANTSGGVSVYGEALGGGGGSAIRALVDNPDGAISATNVGAGPAIDLHTNGGPPMVVDSSMRVPNLNADLLDGIDSTVFARRLWAVVGDDGTLLRGSGAMDAFFSGNSYSVTFDTDVSACAYIATVGKVNSAYNPPDEILAAHVSGRSGGSVFVGVSVNNSAVARAFSLVVLCWSP